MKQIFLIDYENVGLAGLTGISKLGSDDELVIFYSGDISVVKELLSAYKDRGVKISYECLSYAGKNALDFMVCACGIRVPCQKQEGNPYCVQGQRV